jgi:hypothetical protein
VDKPLCRLCGHKHYGLDHVWLVPATHPDVVNRHVVLPSSAVNTVVNKDRHKDKDARRVYLREYMRRRRANQAPR